MLKASDYEFLIALYQSKNITQAAQTLFLSQPALTKRLRQIEQELGAIIVNRNVKGVQFTPEGEYVVRYAEQCISEYKEMKMALHGLQTQKDSTISIVSARTLAHELLPDLFSSFLKEYPQTHLILHAVGSGESAQLVHNGQADIAFVCGEQPWNFQRVQIRTEVMTLLSHKPIRLSELPFMSRIDTSFSVNSQRLISNWWKNTFDVPPRISMIVPSVPTCVAMVSRGLGYSILMDRMAYRNAPQLYQSILKDRQNEAIQRSDYMIYLPGTGLHSPAREFIAFSREYFARLNEIPV